jgi:hypothetical protein
MGRWIVALAALVVAEFTTAHAALDTSGLWGFVTDFTGPTVYHAVAVQSDADLFFHGLESYPGWAPQRGTVDAETGALSADAPGGDCGGTGIVGSVTLDGSSLVGTETIFVQNIHTFPDCVSIPLALAGTREVPPGSLAVDRLTVRTLERTGGTRLALRARGLATDYPAFVWIVDALGREFFLDLQGPFVSTVACSTSLRNGVVTCRAADGTVRWRSAAPAVPTSKARLTVRSGTGLIDLGAPIVLAVAQVAVVSVGRPSLCRVKPGRIACRAD